MIEAHLYGKLREHAPHTSARGESVVRLEPRSDETVATVLERLSISAEDIYHVFLNGSILSSRNSMAPWLRYQEVARHPAERSIASSALDTPVHDGDRVGLFARDMPLLVV